MVKLASISPVLIELFDDRISTLTPLALNSSINSSTFCADISKAIVAILFEKEWWSLIQPPLLLIASIASNKTTFNAPRENPSSRINLDLQRFKCPAKPQPWSRVCQNFHPWVNQWRLPALSLGHQSLPRGIWLCHLWAMLPSAWQIQGRDVRSYQKW